MSNYEQNQSGVIPFDGTDIESYKDIVKMIKVKLSKKEKKIHYFVAVSQFLICQELSANKSKYPDFIYNLTSVSLLIKNIKSMIWRDYEKERINNHLNAFVKNDFELTEENTEYVLKTFDSYLEDLK